MSKEGGGHVRRHQISLAKILKTYSKVNESVKTRLDIIKLSYISITWSLTWKAVWKNDTEGRETIYEVLRLANCGWSWKLNSGMELSEDSL